MTTNDPFLSAARERLELALTELRGCIDGASAEALNWRPGGEDTNSLAVLTVHSLASTRSWLSRATGAPLPPRNRDAEFAANAVDAPSLLALVDEVARDCAALLDRPMAVDWSAILEDIERGPQGMRQRTTTTPPDRESPAAVLASSALIHALEHLREHEGQMFLTRQLWDQPATG